MTRWWPIATISYDHFALIKQRCYKSLLWLKHLQQWWKAFVNPNIEKTMPSMAPLTISNGWLDSFWELQIQNVEPNSSRDYKLKTILKLKTEPSHKIL